MQAFGIPMEKEITFVHTRTQQALMWLGAVVLIAAGVYLTHIRYLGTEWMSRSGCLVVVLGIWSGLGGIIQERVLLGQMELRRRMATVRLRQHMRRRGVEQERMDKELADIDKRYDAKAEKISNHLRLSIGLLEVSLLVTGTLLWGFGDLLPIR